MGRYCVGLFQLVMHRGLSSEKYEDRDNGDRALRSEGSRGTLSSIDSERPTARTHVANSVM